MMMFGLGVVVGVIIGNVTAAVVIAIVAINRDEDEPPIRYPSAP
jgi:hypothetical protein